MSSDRDLDHLAAVAELRRQLNTVRFGSIEIQIHDGRVVQIACTERRRFDRTRPGDPTRRP